MPSGPAHIPYYFFLSYFRRDAKDNPWFTRFYSDLTRDVAARANLPVNMRDEDIRFLDREAIETGDTWHATLAEALQTSRVFVPVYSRGYFKSEYCGKEFGVFRGRVTEYAATLAGGTEPPHLIVPVLWGQPDTIEEALPSSISSIQFTDASFGQLYAEKGLEYLLRMGHNEQSDEYRAYQQVLMALKDKIVREAERHPLPRQQQLAPLAEVANAFVTLRPLEGDVGGRVAPVAPEIAGPDVAWFVFVAGPPGHFTRANITRSLDCYGQLGGREWQPYLPQTRKKIGVIAANVASEKEIIPEWLSVSDALVSQLQEAEEKNTIVVLIVDPWSLQLHPAPLSAYDRTRLSNCGVIVLWNDSDDETQQTRQTLQNQLRQTFSRTLISQDVFFQESSSEAELREKLGAAIDDVYRRVSERAKLVRGVVGTDAGSMPKLPVAPAGRGGTTRPGTPTVGAP